MPEDALRVLTHGGVGSPEAWIDGTDQALEAAREAVADGQDLIEAACRAVAVLEDDPRFNAGTGANLRADGQTVELDAAVADSQGALGAVACLTATKNPVRVARAVAGTDQILLAGQGATALARAHGFEAHDLVTDGARRRYTKAKAGDPVDRDVEDTVGVVITDGQVSAAALSSGGTRLAPVGRVGDVPLPGCGLYAGRAGAVAATGDGEAIARQVLAYRVHRLLDAGRHPQEAVDDALAWFPEGTTVGVIAVTPEGTGVTATGSMAWSVHGPG